MAESQSPQSALPLIVLKILSRVGPLHGYGISGRIQELSESVLAVEEGSLYPALHRLEEAGWIKAKWVITEHKRRARMYEITKEGLKQLETEEERWRVGTAAIARILRYA